MEVFTIGFAKKPASVFFGDLKDHGVGRLMDVRLNNKSQLAGFTKQSDLEYFLRELCAATYVHEPLLTPTSDMLKGYRTKRIDWHEYEHLYTKLIGERQVEDRIRTIAAALVGATSVDRPRDLDVESVIASLVSLTPADLVAARRLVDHLGPGTFPVPPELGPDALFFTARLQAAGLLESVILPASDRTARIGPGYRTDPAIEFRLTPTFGRILDLLRAGGVDTT